MSIRVVKSFIQYKIVIVATYFVDDVVGDKSVDEYELRVFVDIVAVDEVDVSMTLVSRAGTESVVVPLESIDANIVDETLLELNFVGLAALVFNSFFIVSVVSVSVIEAGGYTVGALPLDVVLVLVGIIFRPVKFKDANAVDEKLVILNFVVFIFNSFPELSLAVVNPDGSTIVVTVDALPDVVLVLGFLVVFAVNGVWL